MPINQPQASTLGGNSYQSRKKWTQSAANAIHTVKFFQRQGERKEGRCFGSGYSVTRLGVKGAKHELDRVRKDKLNVGTMKA